MRKPLLAAASAVALATVVALPAGAAPPSTLHLYSKTVHSAFYDAAGAPITDPAHAPVAGDAFTAVANDYRGTKAKHAKARIGTDHIVCTFVDPASARALCDGQIALRGGMIVAD